MRLPKIFAHCFAGCKWETVHRDEFLRSASLVEVYPDENGKWFLEPKKQYKIFAPKDGNGAFSFELYVNYIIGKHYITTSTNDEYADWFVFRLLDYKHIEGTQYKIVYEIEGNRYSEIIADGDSEIEGIVLSGATQVFLYNADATVVARDGKDGAGDGDITELENRVAEIEKDHADNTGFVMMMGGLAENPENDGKVYGIKDEEIVAMDFPQGGGVNIIVADNVEELPDPSDVPEGTIALVPSEDEGGESGDISELEQRVAEIERDHGDNTGFVMHMTGLAENPENEGKVYGIKDEQIVAMDAPTGGGLPPVTEADNGKFLRVVDGAIALVALQDVSEEGL